MAVVGVADQYLILMAIALLFTVLALVFDKILLELLAGITWLISSIAHFAAGDQTSALTISLSWLFLAFGIIFITVAIYNSALLLNRKPDDSWWKE